MQRVNVVIGIIALIVVACDRHAAPPRQIVCVVDATASVPKEMRIRSLDAVRDVVAVLHRGDRISVLPIANDAQLDATQQILRFRLPVEREPYDADLQRVSQEAEAGLQSLLTATQEIPYQHTDLFGTLELA